MVSRSLLGRNTVLSRSLLGRNTVLEILRIALHQQPELVVSSSCWLDSNFG